MLSSKSKLLILIGLYCAFDCLRVAYGYPRGARRRILSHRGGVLGSRRIFEGRFRDRYEDGLGDHLGRRIRDRLGDGPRDSNRYPVRHRIRDRILQRLGEHARGRDYDDIRDPIEGDHEGGPGDRFRDHGHGSRFHGRRGSERDARRPVFCYWDAASQRQAYSIDDIPVDLCTHLVFSPAAALSFEDIGLRYLRSINGSTLDKLMDLRKKDPDLLISLRLGIRLHAGDLSRRMTEVFADNVFSWVSGYGFDGVDLDFCCPESKHCCPNWMPLANVVQEIRRTLQYHRRRLIITVTVPLNDRDQQDGHYMHELARDVDYFNVRTYDFEENGAGVGPSGYRQQNFEEGLRFLVRHGVPEESILLGIPFFGKRYVLKDKSEWCHSFEKDGGRSSCFQRIGSMSYHQICKNLNAGWTQKWDQQEHRPFAYRGDEWISYENERSIRVKVQHIQRRQYGGVAVWTVDMDDHTGDCGRKEHLLKTIQEELNAVVFPTVAPTRPVQSTTAARQLTNYSPTSHVNTSTSNSGVPPMTTGRVGLATSVEVVIPTATRPATHAPPASVKTTLPRTHTISTTKSRITELRTPEDSMTSASMQSHSTSFSSRTEAVTVGTSTIPPATVAATTTLQTAKVSFSRSGQPHPGTHNNSTLDEAPLIPQTGTTPYTTSTTDAHTTTDSEWGEATTVDRFRATSRISRPRTEISAPSPSTSTAPLDEEAAPSSLQGTTSPPELSSVPTDAVTKDEAAGTTSSSYQRMGAGTSPVTGGLQSHSPGTQEITPSFPTRSTSGPSRTATDGHTTIDSQWGEATTVDRFRVTSQISPLRRESSTPSSLPSIPTAPSEDAAALSSPQDTTEAPKLSSESTDAVTQGEAAGTTPSSYPQVGAETSTVTGDLPSHSPGTQEITSSFSAQSTSGPSRTFTDGHTTTDSQWGEATTVERFRVTSRISPLRTETSTPSSLPSVPTAPSEDEAAPSSPQDTTEPSELSSESTDAVTKGEAAAATSSSYPRVGAGASTVTRSLSSHLARIQETVTSFPTQSTSVRFPTSTDARTTTDTESGEATTVDQFRATSRISPIRTATPTPSPSTPAAPFGDDATPSSLSDATSPPIMANVPTDAVTNGEVAETTSASFSRLGAETNTVADYLSRHSARTQGTRTSFPALPTRGPSRATTRTDTVTGSKWGEATTVDHFHAISRMSTLRTENSTPSRTLSPSLVDGTAGSSSQNYTPPLEFTAAPTDTVTKEEEMRATSSYPGAGAGTSPAIGGDLSSDVLEVQGVTTSFPTPSTRGPSHRAAEITTDSERGESTTTDQSRATSEISLLTVKSSASSPSPVTRGLGATTVHTPTGGSEGAAGITLIRNSQACKNATAQLGPDGANTAILVPHEKECTKFYYCDHGTAYLHHCPAGNIFDTEKRVCVWPDKVNRPDCQTATTVASK